jgi:asparagine synthase (glutamine-hydrolysing)
VLGVATRAARRAGLPLPVPITWVYDDEGQEEESPWQELAVRELGLEDWVRLPAGDSMDAIGPVAGPLLRRHGSYYPGNAHMLVPLLERAAGGTLLTGWGGHELLRAWRWARPWSVLGGRVRPEPRDVLRIANMAAPAGVRRYRERRAAAERMAPWLLPEVSRELLVAATADRAGEPRRWDYRIAWYASRRFLSLTGATLARFAAEAGAHIAHPLQDRGFLSSLAAQGGWKGWGSWSTALPALFGEAVPTELLTRRSGTFPDAVWGPEASAFAASWSGGGVDTEIVSEEALRAAWDEEPLPRRSVHLLQAAWLGQQVAVDSAADT